MVWWEPAILETTDLPKITLAILLALAPCQDISQRMAAYSSSELIETYQHLERSCPTLIKVLFIAELRSS